jgi:predicted enzyme related to lactoylglutathione lyase
MEITGYTPGDFCGPELTTRDLAAAKSFYTALFGWTASDRGDRDGVTYVVLEKDGRDVAALASPSGGDPGGASPHWMPYVAVKSADEAAAKAAALGGEVRKEPADVTDAGRKAIVADPLGASFGLWQPRRRIGSRLLGEAGSFCWNQLYTSDAERAASFYGELFGWRRERATLPMPPYDYTVFRLGELNVAGMMVIPKEWGPVPPHWIVYFAVESCDAGNRDAVGLGADSVFPPTDFPNVGRLAILKDPQGAAFALFTAARR